MQTLIFWCSADCSRLEIQYMNVVYFLDFKVLVCNIAFLDYNNATSSRNDKEIWKFMITLILDEILQC